MGEHISREAARPDVFCEGVSCQNCPFCKDSVLGGCRIDDFVKSIPAADVVEVVRCKDCKYWVQRSDREYGLCNRNQGVWLNSDYCAKGKRKGGGQNDA